MSKGNYVMSLDEIKGGEELREDVKTITTNKIYFISFIITFYWVCSHP